MIKKIFVISLFFLLTSVLYGESKISDSSYSGLNFQIQEYGGGSFGSSILSDGFNPSLEQSKTIFAAVTKKSSGAQIKKQPAKKSGGPTVLNICGYVLIAAGVGGLGAGYYFDTQASQNIKDAQSKYDDYKNASGGFDDKWSAYQDKLNLAKQNTQYRNYSYIGGGVALGVGLVLAFVPIPFGSKKNYSIYITPDSIYAAYRF